ncbi:T9SS type A sorting domain-containing protein [candidate division KSB1 bacterium]|nr:T9SS type A sorting domain-containing protein [candidate division KSB1 bacterium]
MKKRVLFFTLLCLAFSALLISQEEPGQLIKKAAPEVTIHDIQYVPDSLLLLGNDDSPFLGDTVTVEGIALSGPREIYVGARWSVFLSMPEGGPWSALQVIQHDTLVTGTNFTVIEPGDRVKITGIMEEYPTTGRSSTQMRLITNPPVSIELISAGNPFPEPVVVKCSDLNSNVIAERYESVFVTIKDAVVVNNALPGLQMQINDGSGEVIIDEYFNKLHNPLTDGSYKYPGIGTHVDVTGNIRDYQNFYYVCPRDPAAIIARTEPPAISELTRNPVMPKSTENAVVQVKIIDANGTVNAAKLFYSVNYQAFQELEMKASDENMFAASVPKSPNGSFVRYFLWAQDNDLETVFFPGDTTSAMLFYTVRDSGLTIYDVEWTPYKNGNSGYVGQILTLTGVVVADSSHFSGNYVIQTKAAPWHGIWVYDRNHGFKLGDLISVTGTVEESYNFTRLTNVTSAKVLSRGHVIEPLLVTTGTLMTGSPLAESYENVLVEVRNLTISDPFPDTPSNFGEFSITDGTGSIRVDDLALTFDGNLDSVYALGDSLAVLRGIQTFSFYNYKIIPRSAADVIQKTTGVTTNPGRAEVYELAQNYPNPFNPTTTIRYTLGQTEAVRLVIYNLQGQKIKTLVQSSQAAGQYTCEWDGTNEQHLAVASGLYFYQLQAGNFKQIRKLLLVR